jgi:hypothetical protein
VTISKDLQRFNSPDFGLKGPKVSPFKKGMPTNTTPGIANNVDIFSGVTEMMEDYYSPERADDGISGTRLAKVLYYEVLDTETFLGLFCAYTLQFLEAAARCSLFLGHNYQWIKQI